MPDDAEAIDAIVRAMLVSGENRWELWYEEPLEREQASLLTQRFTECVKSYCEQMYNSVQSGIYANGRVTLRFYALSTGDDDETLERERQETIARAAEVHDALWESGLLSEEQSDYEKARVYYIWLCDHCAYDFSAAEDDFSPSHLASSALLDGYAVCDGYTGAYNLLLKLEGIACTAQFNDTHIWTVAELDGETYYIDTTWGDQTGRIDMKYFGMNAEQSAIAHSS